VSSQCAQWTAGALTHVQVAAIDHCCQSRELAFGCLTGGLLVIVGAEVFSTTKIGELRRRWRVAARLSIDVDVDPAVDLIGILNRDGPQYSRNRPSPN